MGRKYSECQVWDGVDREKPQGIYTNAYNGPSPSIFKVGHRERPEIMAQTCVA